MSYNRLLLLFLLIPVCAAAGGKQRNPPPKYQISTYVDDGAWLWFNDQHIIMDDGVIYIGTEDSKGYSTVNIYQLKGKLKHVVSYPLSTWAARDDHNYPALLKLKDGNLLATYSRNPSRKMYFRIAKIISDKQGQKELKWGDENVIDLTNGMSYNNSIQLSDENNRIYNWYSIFTGSPAILRSDDQGKTWSKDFSYMQAGKNHSSPYLKYVSDGKKRVDILYTDGHPRNEAYNNIYHMYYQSGQFYQTDGKLIKSLDSAMLNPIAAEEGTKIYDGKKEGPGWVWDIAYDQHKNPVAVYISAADFAQGNDLRYRYASWDPTSKKWEEREIAYAGNHLYVPENHFAGGITIDPENTNVVYISSNVNPYTGKSSKNQHFQIYRGTTKNKGKNWSWEQLTFDTDQDNLRPVVPQVHKAEISVFWFTGVYKSSLNFKTKVVGIVQNTK